MPVTKEEVVYQRRILDDGSIQMHMKSVILENGVQVGEYTHVRTIQVGDSVVAETDAIAKEIATAIHIQQRIDAKAAAVLARANGANDNE